MLDRRMMYTCALWSTGATTLEEAQDAKLALVCKKLGLRAGMRVLDLGCGWGGFAAYAAEQHGDRGRRLHGVEGAGAIRARAPRAPGGQSASTTTATRPATTPSSRSACSSTSGRKTIAATWRWSIAASRRAASRSCTSAGAPARSIPGSTSTSSRTRRCPPLAQLAVRCRTASSSRTSTTSARDYDPTLMAWHARFRRRVNRLLRGTFRQPFHRMWKFYLLASAGSFRARPAALPDRVHAPSARARRSPRVTDRDGQSKHFASVHSNVLDDLLAIVERYSFFIGTSHRRTG